MSATLEQPLTELSHDVHVVVRDGLATFTVQRALRNSGTKHEEAVLLIDLPPDAVATGLRIKARDTWYQGELLDAADAAERYTELTGMGGYSPKDPALLAWVNHRTLSLQVFPVFPGGTSTIEYTLVAPTGYRDGRRVIYYPDAVAESGLPQPNIRVEGGTLRVTRGVTEVELPDEGDDPSDDAEEKDHVSTSTWSDGTLTRIEIRPDAIPTIAARYGVMAASFEHTVLRFELDAARELGAAPREAHVVFVIDASRSEGDDGVAAQLGLIHGYLAELPDAKVEIVVFRRRAERLFGRFVAAGEVATHLRAARARLEPGNGSNLDQGLAVAADALCGVRGAARVVAMSDARLRSAFTAPLAVAAFHRAPAGTILHVVVRDGESGQGGALTEARDDSHPLAPVAASRGGMVLVVEGGWDKLAQLRGVARGLVRPIRIDGLSIDAPGVEGLDPPEALKEGTGISRSLLVAAAPPQIAVRGWIWGRRFERLVSIDPAFSRTAAALFVTDPSFNDLDESEMMRVALSGRAVSRVTSYLAIEPGTRPSTAGIERGGSGSGYGVGSGRGGMYGVSGGERNVDFVGFLREHLLPGVQACMRRHHVDTFQGIITIETTGHEIVDVAIDRYAPWKLGACLTEAAWQIDLEAPASVPGAQGLRAAPRFPGERTAYPVELDVQQP